MDNDLKKQFAMRIPQANNVQMIMISYEIIDAYLLEAKGYQAGSGDYVLSIDKAKRCIEEMMNNLHYEYDIAKDLKQLYLYMKKRLRQAICEKDADAIEEVRKMINQLHDSYESIADTDNSQPMMQNAQSVVAGMTYGKSKTLDEAPTDIENRGFRV
jgi:flagellar protein FliS